MGCDASKIVKPEKRQPDAPYQESIEETRKRIISAIGAKGIDTKFGVSNSQRETTIKLFTEIEKVQKTSPNASFANILIGTLSFKQLTQKTLSLDPDGAAVQNSNDDPCFNITDFDLRDSESGEEIKSQFTATVPSD